MKLFLKAACGMAFVFIAAAQYFPDGRREAAASNEPIADGIGATGVAGAVALAAPGRGYSQAVTMAEYSLDRYALYMPPPPWQDGNSSVSPAISEAEVGDVTGDARKDVVIVVLPMAPPASRRVYIYPQLENGTLGIPLEYPLPDYGGGVIGTGMADFNEDGAQDILVTRAMSLNLLVSDGRGGFSSREYAQLDRPADVPAVVLDVNLDGHLDVVGHVALGYGQQSSDKTAKLVYYYGDGFGNIVAHQAIVTGAIEPGDDEAVKYLAAGDLNGDGFTDLALTSREYLYGEQAYRHLLAVRYHDGLSGFGPPQNLVVRGYGGTPGPIPEALAIGDFNGDGRKDVAAGDFVVGASQPTIYIYRQTTAGTLETTPITKPTSGGVTALEAADIDRDGRDDLLTVHDGQERIAYYLQRAGQLQDAIYRPAGSSSVATGDINGDGCPDAVAAGNYAGLTLLRGTNCKAPVSLAVCLTQEPVASLRMAGDAQSSISSANPGARLWAADRAEKPLSRHTANYAARGRLFQRVAGSAQAMTHDDTDWANTAKSEPSRALLQALKAHVPELTGMDADEWTGKTVLKFRAGRTEAEAFMAEASALSTLFRAPVRVEVVDPSTKN